MNEITKIFLNYDLDDQSSDDAVGEKISEDLQAYRRKLYTTFVVLCSVLVFIVLLMIFFSWIYMGKCEAESAKVISGIIGVSGSGGILGLLLRTWKEWSRVDLLIILMQNADAKLVTAVGKKLISSLK